jgi:hypothetical protein
MPLDNFDGETFVAFTDISGFKAMMGEPARAVRALDSFCTAGYEALRRQAGGPRVEGLFISDCGVLFVRGDGHDTHAGLRSLLAVVEAINRVVLGAVPGLGRRLITPVTLTRERTGERRPV